MSLPLLRRAHPAALLLVLQAAVVFAALAGAPDFRTEMTADSKGYLWDFESPLYDALLNNKRTFGYPLFLAAVETVTGGREAVAAAQLAFFLAAAVAFGFAARAFLGSWWLALAAASPLLYARLARLEGHRVMSDLPSATWAVLAVACLLWLLRRPRPLAWALLTLTVFLTYQTRPAYLFLLPLLPLAGVLLPWLQSAPPRRLSAALGSRTCLGLVVAVLAPYLLWCSLRYAAFGHFGLVSFGGLNVIGITAPMITAELLPELEEPDRALAASVLNARRELAVPEVAPDYDYAVWSYQFNRNAHSVVWRAWQALGRERVGGTSPRWIEVNRAFTSLSWQVIRRRPGLYLEWLWQAHLETWASLWQARTVRWPLLALLLLGVAWALLRRRGGAPGPDPPRSTALALGLLALLYLASSLLLVLLVEKPLERYTFACGLFVPSALTLLAAELAGAMQKNLSQKQTGRA